FTIMRAIGQPVRRFLIRSRDRPNRGVVTELFFIHTHAHKGDARPIRRNLRITDPDEIEQILFGNAAFVRGLRRDRDEREKCEQNQATQVTWQHSPMLPAEWRAGTLFPHRNSSGMIAPATMPGSLASHLKHSP